MFYIIIFIVAIATYFAAVYKKHRYWFGLIAIALLYIIVAKLGLSMAETTKQVTTIWPATGVALVTLVMLGPKFWPGIFVGAFVANLFTQEPAGVAFFIAIGNTLEAVVGAYLLHRIVSFKGYLNTINAVLGFVCLAAVFSTALSATIGTLSLAIGGLITWQHYMSVWLVWWVGDMMGDLILAPFLFVVLTKKFWKVQTGRRLEWFLLVLSAVSVALLAFTASHETTLADFSLIYMTFPIAIWAALRFYDVGAATTTLIFTAVAILGTMHKRGPFIKGDSFEQDLLFLYVFMAVLACTSLLMGAAIAERRESELRLLDYSKDLVKTKNHLLRNISKGKRIEQQKDQLVSMASHELRTPLTSALLFLQILDREVKRENFTPEAVTEHVNRVFQALNRLAKLTGDIIELSRSKAGKLRVQKEWIRASDVIDATVADMQMTAPSHTLRIAERSNRLVFADAVRLRQVLVNLINNAIKYSPAGTEIVIGMRVSKRRMIVSVRDQGEGISKKEQTKIFEPFYQRADGKAQAGLGLGLHISREIIDMHNGEFWVESAPKKGATFYFTLPLPAAKRERKV